MYKIVETIEKGSKQLTVVPQAWEQEGILFWPKMKAEKLIKIGTSIPEDSWFQMSCKLKRRELETYETAEKELRAMLKKEDSTESEEPEVVPRPKRVRVMLPKKSTSGYDFNEMAIKAVCTVSFPVFFHMEGIKHFNFVLYRMQTRLHLKLLNTASHQKIL